MQTPILQQSKHHHTKLEYGIIGLLFLCIPVFMFVGYQMGYNQALKTMKQVVSQVNTNTPASPNIDYLKQPFLLKITARGGLCVPSDPCESNTVVQHDGQVIKDGKLQKILSSKQTAELKKAIDEGDYFEMKNHPFQGTCPIAADGQELTYAFSLGDHLENLPSCTYDLENAPLIKFVHTMID